MPDLTDVRKKKIPEQTEARKKMPKEPKQASRNVHKTHQEPMSKREKLELSRESSMPSKKNGS